ncbi:hypothetical protein ABZ547_26555 [Streptomyces sparsogenes]|uniref:hypothetical protein n=1 Tax=Streptomyces sparsogenes TaxID=67365 RepID=UPI0033FCDEA5
MVRVTSMRSLGSADGTYLLSMAEIAALAAVQRPVVSTWRRRYPDFPQPITPSAGRPLFDGGEVAEWLIGTGRGKTAPAQLRAEMVLHGIAAHADSTDPLRLVEILGALLCLHHLDDRPLTVGTGVGEAWEALVRRAERMDPDDEFVLREIKAADDSAVILALLAEDLIEAAYGPSGAYEWLLASRARLGLADLTADALSPEPQQLLVQVADLPSRAARRRTVTIADPHARAGDLLAALVREWGDRDALGMLAADPDARLARITRRRLLLAGVPEYSLDVQTGLNLEEQLADPDLIVTQLPYRPGEDRSTLAALEGIERVADLLRPGSTALILGPADALIDELPGTPESQLRSALLRSGIVEAIVNLPGGVTPYRPGYRCALWVLTRSPIPAAQGYVLLADISAEPLNAHVRTRLAEDILLWRAEGHRADGHDPRYGRIVRVAVLDQAFGGPLTPPGPPASQILSRTVAERPALIAEAEARLEEATEQAQQYAAAHGPLRGHVVQRTANRPARTTLGALIAENRVTKIKGHRIDPGHLTPTGHHPVLGPEEATGHNRAGTRRIDRIILAEHYEHAAFTEPGDLIYTLAPELGLQIDHDGFSVVAFPARVLRVNPEAQRPLTPRVLAALLGAARGTGRSPSAVRAARRIEDFPLPDLDPSDVSAFDAFLAETEHRQDMLRAQAAALIDAHRLTVAGLADGTLTIDRLSHSLHTH